MSRQSQRVSWLISRMARIVFLWDFKIGGDEKRFILRRIRDKEPRLFYEIAKEPALEAIAEHMEMRYRGGV